VFRGCLPRDIREAREKNVKTYTVSQLAKMAGVSVRTIHHYDHIDLLKPSSRTAAGYRIYGEDDLLHLQQILFFKEFDFSLAQIAEIINDPEFDLIEALENHRRRLQERSERLVRLLNTIDKTIHRLEEDNEMGMTDQELYEGFTPEQAEQYQQGARDLYGPAIVAETEKRIRKMSKAQWTAIKENGAKITRAIAKVADEEPSAPEVQALIAQHHAWIEHFYPAPADLYRSLGQGYAEHPDFRKFYDQYRIDLADFMQAAMAYYADHTLAKNAEA
jgi:DNA-binding transcriptional MerR regulator